jgi:hypothetical protein
LLQDLLSLAGEDSFPHQEKFARTLSRIGDQVARGVELSTKLNAFAHSGDEAVASVDLNEILGHVVFLCQRFARLKGIQLRAEASAQPIILVTSPLRLQMLLFECLDLLMSIEKAGTILSFRPARRTDKELSIDIACEREGQPSNNFLPDISTLVRWPDLQESAESVRARIELASAPVRLRLVFTPEAR